MKRFLMLLLSSWMLTVAAHAGGPLATETRAPDGRYAAAGVTDSSAADNFFRSLQKAVARNERRKVAGMVRFPLSVRVAGRRVVLKRRADLLRHYNAVFTSNFKNALAAQQTGKLFNNWQGVMIGSGEIWFNQMPGRRVVFKVTAINN